MFEMLLLLQDELLKRKLIEFMDEILKRAEEEGLTGDIKLVLDLKERKGEAFKDDLFLVGLSWPKKEAKNA